MTKEELIQQLSKYKFDEKNVDVALRADFKCEYCDRDMLEDMDAYKLWQIDHIIPQYLGLSDKDELENLALSCVQCNKDLKGKWDVSGQTIDPQRKIYIFLIREYIKEKRAIKNVEVAEIRAIVDDFRKNNQ